MPIDPTAARWRTVLASLALTAAASSQAEHQLPGSSLVFEGGRRLLLADVNGDGRADLIYDDSNLLDGDVRLSRPDGTFGAAAQLADAGLPTAVADFTDDGIVDVLAFKIDARVLPGLGDGSFGPLIKTPGLKPTYTEPVAVGDVDLDGHLDFAWHYVSAPAQYIQVGHGDGTFAALPQVVFVSGNIKCSGLADLDSDGDLDVYASATDSGETLVARGTNDGSGGIGATESTKWSGWWALQLAPHDFDGDGWLDFVASGGPRASGQAVSLLRGTAAGIEVEQTLELGFPTGFGDVGPESWIGDVDGDGAADLLVASNSTAVPGGQTFFLHGGGGFAFSPPVISATDFSPPTKWADKDRYFQFVDVDADGRLDVVAFNGTWADGIFTKSLEIASGHGDGTFDASASATTGVGLSDVAAADLDGDGVTDLVASSTDGMPQLLAHLGVGDGTFADPPQPSAVQFASHVLAADFTGDGHADALTWSGEAAGRGALCIGQGDGTFASTFTVGSAPVRDAAIGDLDLDGLPDVAFSQPSLGLVTLWSSSGDGSLVAYASLDTGSNLGGVGIGDVTADGRNDVMATREVGASVVLFEDAGSFGAAPPIELATNPFPHTVLAVDLDVDGRLDIATACGSTGSQSADRAVSVLQSLGGGDFVPVQTWPADVAAGQITSGDFDRDGWPDLVLATLDDVFLQEWPGDMQELAVEILHGAPGGLPGQRVGVRSGGTSVGVAVADFDANGHPDLAVALADQPHVRVHLSRAATWSTLGQALPSPAGVPLLTGVGEPIPDQLVIVTSSLGPAPSLGMLFIGLSAPFAPFQGGVLVPSPDVVVPVRADFELAQRWPKGVPAGTPVYLQVWFQSLATGEVSASNALVTIAQ
jgi:FG-GAP-like repeat